MASALTIEVTDANFSDSVLNADVPVVVDFWAPWCQPCRMIAPVLDQLAGKYEGKVTVGKCNVDNNQALAQKYRITGIPAMLAFKGGEEVARVVGANPKRIDQVFQQVAG